MLVFLPLDCIGEVFTCMACCILEIEAGARVNDGNVEKKRLILASRVVAEECPPPPLLCPLLILIIEGLICRFVR